MTKHRPHYEAETKIIHGLVFREDTIVGKTVAQPRGPLSHRLVVLNLMQIPGRAQAHGRPKEALNIDK